ncbi:hypothetical protein C0J45_21147 [Silurus meridionalis]|nr:hypothetical protein C0J45_21147 [Silurus meridionalis]
MYEMTSTLQRDKRHGSRRHSSSSGSPFSRLLMSPRVATVTLTSTRTASEKRHVHQTNVHTQRRRQRGGEWR